MIKDILNDYLGGLYRLFSGGDAREESYYVVFEVLLKELQRVMKHPDLEVVVTPKTSEAGNPDFAVIHRQFGRVGYIEAKDPSVDIDVVERSEQIKRYREVFPNLMVTNFFDFRLYRNGERIAMGMASRREMLIDIGLRPVPEGEPLRQELTALFDAFFSYRFPTDLDSRRLAGALARRTRFMRDHVVLEELKRAPAEPAEPVDGAGVKQDSIPGFYRAFKTYLIHGLTRREFADLYSQTLTFGLFTAAVRCGEEKFERETAARYIPYANGILRRVFQFISMGGISKQLECIMNDIADVLDRVKISRLLAEYRDRGMGEDPILHFYETFLGEYDPKLKETRGVFYTPRPVVSFIVNSVHVALRDKLGRSDGLSDPGLRILDPAVGTSTFLAGVTEKAISEYTARYGVGGRRDFARNYVLNCLYGFEFMVAPYAVSFLKMAHMLDRENVRLSPQDRLNIYLTNSLEVEDIEQSSLPGMAALSGEAGKAGRVKKGTPITVILGNPPYAGHSLTSGSHWVSRPTRSNKNRRVREKTWIGEQLDAYKRIDGKPLREKNLKWLQDDYVKFMRFAQVKIEENGEGVVAFITNHAYLDNPTFRGMRRSLMDTFDEIYILDLHGNAMKNERSPDGKPDENVFDIRQGTAIGIFIKTRSGMRGCRVYYAEMWGKRASKYDRLGKSDLGSLEWQRVLPGPEFYLFRPPRDTGDRTAVAAVRYGHYFKITDIFPVHSVGIVTARDKLTIREDPDALYRVALQFSETDAETARIIFNVGEDSRDWQVSRAQEDLLATGPDRSRVVPVLYRPFDLRYTYYTGNSRGFLCMPRSGVMRHMLPGNTALVTVRQVAEEAFSHCLVTDHMVESRITTSNKGIGYMFPLYRYLFPRQDLSVLFNRGRGPNETLPREPNMNPVLFNFLRENAGFTSLPTVEEVFYYIYGVLYSTIYREVHLESLRLDFPRIPFTSDQELFARVSRLGARLAGLHRLTIPPPAYLEPDRPKAGPLPPGPRFEIKGDNLVKRVVFVPIKNSRGEETDGRVYINESQYFSGIMRSVWEYRICGYQVLSKWLKPRKGKYLRFDEISHYIKIAHCIKKTIAIQRRIDRFYPQIEKTVAV